MRVKDIKKRLHVVLIKTKWFLIKRKNDFLNLQRWQLICVALLIIPFAGISLQGIKSLNSEESQRAYYKKQIESISYEITSIDKLISDPHAVTETVELKSYGNRLDTIISRCHSIIKRRDDNANKFPDIQKVSDASANVCQDLVSVAVYQKNLYRQLETILLINTRQLPEYGHPNAAIAIKNIGSNISQAKHNINRIKNTRFQDPAQKEIENILVKLADKSNELQKNHEPQQYNQFLLQIDQSRIGLMQHRTYYWKNTVEIEGIKEALKKIDQHL